MSATSIRLASLPSTICPAVTGVISSTGSVLASRSPEMLVAVRTGPTSAIAATPKAATKPKNVRPISLRRCTAADAPPP